MTAGDSDDVLLILPDEHRVEFKDPLGEIYTDADELLKVASEPIIAVGDVVTKTLLDAGHSPLVSVVDGHTEREPVDSDVREQTRSIDRVIEVANPAGAITSALAEALVRAMDDPAPVRIEVDGEEDLAVIPAILAAPIGATVVYGQPGEGMVAVSVTAELLEEIRRLLTYFEGDQEAFLTILDPESV